jgi:hypothetical protein
MQKMEDSSQRLIYDCRLPIVDLRSAPILAAHENAFSRSGTEI